MDPRQAFLACLERAPLKVFEAALWIAAEHDGALDPEAVVTPGIFVSRVVQVPRVATQAGGIKQ